MKMPNPVVPCVEHLVEKTGPSGTSIPPPTSPVAEPDVDATHDRVDEDEAPALLDLA